MQVRLPYNSYLLSTQHVPSLTQSARTVGEHSMLYKSKLPMVLCFNKTDVAPHQFAVEWMEDFEKFQVLHADVSAAFCVDVCAGA